MGFIETSYGSIPNLSQVHIDSDLNLGTYGITTDGELNINDSDLIGVNQFICKDYLGAVLTEASNVPQWTLILNDVVGNTFSKKFRVPSNFIDSSTINLKFYGSNTANVSRTIYLDKYNQDGTVTVIQQVSIPANTSTPTEFALSNISIKAGEIYLFRGGTNCTFHGSQGVTICCNLSSVTGGYWVISD